MKRISMKISAIAVALAVTASSITFCVPTKINADLEALTGGCDKTHSGDVWSGDSFLEEGSYHLESDVPLTSEIEITTNVTLCLNGHEIIAENGSRAFNIKDGGSLTLCDCKETGKIIGIHDSDNDSDSENENESNSDNDSDSKDPVKHGGAVYYKTVPSQCTAVRSRDSLQIKAAVYTTEAHLQCMEAQSLKTLRKKAAAYM